METLKIRNALEVATNVAVLLAATGILTALSWSYFAQKRTPALQNGFQRGLAVARLPQIDYGSAKQTLLIAMNTQCHFCTQSIPFFNKLAESQRGKSNSTHIIALFPNEEREVYQYLQQNQLQLEIVSKIDFTTLNINGTPTMILVDSNGKILDFWIGKPSDEDERHIIKAITIS